MLKSLESGGTWKHVYYTQSFLPSQAEVVIPRKNAPWAALLLPQEQRCFMLCLEEQAQLRGCWGGRDPHGQHLLQGRNQQISFCQAEIARQHLFGVPSFSQVSRVSVVATPWLLSHVHMPYKYLHLCPWKVMLMFSSLIPIDGTKYLQRLEMIVVEESTLVLEDGKEAL